MRTILTAILLMLLASCKTSHVVSSSESHSSTQQDKKSSVTSSDSLIYRDSTHVYIHITGDTIYNTVEKFVYRDRVSVKTDTLTLMRTDTVTRYVTETTIKESGKPPWHITMILFVFMSAIIIITLTIIRKTKQ